MKQSLFVEFKVNPVPSVCVKVVSLSAPKVITALSDVRLMSSETVMSPLKTGVAVKVATPVTANVEAMVTAPETLAVPSTTKPSLMLIVLESSELIVVPAILIADATTPPVPLGNKIMSSFDLADVIRFPFTSRSPPNWGVVSYNRSGSLSVIYVLPSSVNCHLSVVSFHLNSTSVAVPLLITNAH